MELANQPEGAVHLMAVTLVQVIQQSGPFLGGVLARSCVRLIVHG